MWHIETRIFSHLPASESNDETIVFLLSFACFFRELPIAPLSSSECSPPVVTSGEAKKVSRSKGKLVAGENSSPFQRVATLRQLPGRGNREKTLLKGCGGYSDSFFLLQLGPFYPTAVLFPVINLAWRLQTRLNELARLGELSTAARSALPDLCFSAYNLNKFSSFFP